MIADVVGKLGELLGLTSPLIAGRSPIRLGVARVQVAEKLGRSLLVAPIANNDAVGQPAARSPDRLDRVTVESGAAGVGLRVTNPANQSATTGLGQGLGEQAGGSAVPAARAYWLARRTALRLRAAGSR